MEPREAASLPVPGPRILDAVWRRLQPERTALDRQLRRGFWTTVAKRVDEVLLREVLDLSPGEARTLHEAAQALRARRLGREPKADD
jgi:hypothetical protein